MMTRLTHAFAAHKPSHHSSQCTPLRGGTNPTPRATRYGWVVSVASMTALAAASCSHTPPVSPATAEPVSAHDYTRVYNAWTRSDDLFTTQSMNDILHATATWETLPFRMAYIERYSADYAVSPAVKRDLLAHARTEAAQEQRFLVTVAGDEYRESDLTHKRTAWQLLLVDGNNQAVQPTRVEKIARPTPALRVYFPSMSPFRQAFRVYFPAKLAGGSPFPTRGSRSVKLRFTGALGTVDLTWDLAAPTVANPP
jgi:hypothetical protein